MSWSCSAIIPKGATEEQMGQIFGATNVNGNDDCLTERKVAFEYAAEAAMGLMLSGVYGNPAECGFAVNLSGHCNPSNQPREGWSKDCLTVTIAQV